MHLKLLWKSPEKFLKALTHKHYSTPLKSSLEPAKKKPQNHPLNSCNPFWNPLKFHEITPAKQGNLRIGYMKILEEILENHRINIRDILVKILGVSGKFSEIFQRFQWKDISENSRQDIKEVPCAISRESLERFQRNLWKGFRENFEKSSRELSDRHKKKFAERLQGNFLRYFRKIQERIAEWCRVLGCFQKFSFWELSGI